MGRHRIDQDRSPDTRTNSLASRRWVLALAPLLLLLGFGGWTLVYEEGRFSRRPPTPEWVDPQGRVDLSRLPSRIGVIDSAGRLVGWIDPQEEPFWMAPPPPGTPAPCRYKVRDAQGRLIGYLSAEPAGEADQTKDFIGNKTCGIRSPHSLHRGIQDAELRQGFCLLPDFPKPHWDDPRGF